MAAEAGEGRLGKNLAGVLVGALVAIVSSAYTQHLQARSQERQLLLERRLDLVGSLDRACAEVSYAMNDQIAIQREEVEVLREPESVKKTAFWTKDATETTKRAREAERRSQAAWAEVRMRYTMAEALFGVDVSKEREAALNEKGFVGPTPAVDLAALPAIMASLEAAESRAQRYEDECRALNSDFMRALGIRSPE